MERKIQNNVALSIFRYLVSAQEGTWGLVLALEDGRGQAVGVALGVASGTHSSALAPGALLTVHSRGEAGLLRSDAVARGRSSKLGLLELALEDGGREGLGVGLGEAGATDCGAVAPGALVRAGSGAHAGLLGSDGVAGGRLQSSLLVLALENRGRERLGISLTHAGAADGGTVAPRAVLTGGAAGHAGFFGGHGVAIDGSLQNSFLKLTLEHGRRKTLSIRSLKAASANGGTIAPRAFLTLGRSGHAGLLAGDGVTSGIRHVVSHTVSTDGQNLSAKGNKNDKGAHFLLSLFNLSTGIKRNSSCLSRPSKTVPERVALQHTTHVIGNL